MEEEGIRKHTDHREAGKTGEEHESAAGKDAAASPPVMELGDLPETYQGEAGIVLLPLSPWQVHAYWRTGPDFSEESQRDPSSKGRSLKPILRFHDVSDIPSGETGEWETLDVPIDLDAKRGYYQFCLPGRSYFVDLGLLKEDDQLVLLARSNVVQMPFAEPVPKAIEALKPALEQRGQIPPSPFAVSAEAQPKRGPRPANRRAAETQAVQADQLSGASQPPHPAEERSPDAVREARALREVLMGDEAGTKVGVALIGAEEEPLETSLDGILEDERTGGDAETRERKSRTEGAPIPQYPMSRALLRRVEVVAPANVLELIRRKYAELHRLSGDIWRFFKLPDQAAAGEAPQILLALKEAEPPDLTELSEKRFVVGISSAPQVSQ